MYRRLINENDVHDDVPRAAGGTLGVWIPVEEINHEIARLKKNIREEGPAGGFMACQMMGAINILTEILG